MITSHDRCRIWLLGIAGAFALAASYGLAGEPPSAPEHPLVGKKFEPKDVDYDHPVYQTSFDDETVLKDWQLEGGKRASVSKGNLVLESEPRQTDRGKDPNHLVFWLKKEVPADFLLEFTVRPQNRREGLNIVFFNARGIGGQSIFDPSLQPRGGVFKQYHSGDLNNYHVSYWAGTRGFANLRKNHGFHLVASGKDYIISGDADAFQTVQIYKRGAKIRVAVDGLVSVAFDDDGQTYGPVLDQSGWIGLRQMGHTLRCEYGHVKIWPLKPAGAANASDAASSLELARRSSDRVN